MGLQHGFPGFNPSENILSAVVIEGVYVKYRFASSLCVH